MNVIEGAKRAARATAVAGLIAGAVTTPAAAGPDGQVKIGILNDQSGPYAAGSGQGSVVMAEYAVEDFGGTVLGKPVTIVNADHQNKSDVGSAIARRWIDVEQVDAIFDVPNSGVMLALQEVVRSKGGLLFSNAGASSFTANHCSPYGFQWTFDSFALASGAGRALVRDGLKDWFLIQTEGAFGDSAGGDVESVISGDGGRIVGRVKVPFNTADFSSFLLQAQASRAKVVAFLIAGNDVVTAVKQANEFGLSAAGQRLFALVFTQNDAVAGGLQNTRGLVTTSPFYWASGEKAEAVSKRFLAKMGRAPTWTQIGTYSSVMHYLKAVRSVGSLDRDKLAAQVRASQVNDAFTVGGTVRIDGRMLHDMFLTQVRTPEEIKSSSKGDWDVFKILSVIPASESARPPDPACSLVAK